jgi:hypothetical protein
MAAWLLILIIAASATLGGKLSEVPISKIDNPVERKALRNNCDITGPFETCDIGDNQLLLVYNKVNPELIKG